MPKPADAPKPRVLLVEDDPSLRRSMQLLLQGRGFDIRAYAAPGAMLMDDGIGEATCLIADYRLGESDGIQVLGALRQRGWGGAAILVTAFSTPELRRSAESAGFDALIEKPFLDHALVNAITRLTAP